MAEFSSLINNFERKKFQKKAGDAVLKAAGNKLLAQSRFNLQPSLCLARQ
jgi:hypothetical protein